MRGQLYVIESRDANGALLFRDVDGKYLPGPETAFGSPAIAGLDDDAMAKVIFHHKPDVILDGRYVADWPAILNPNWKARLKTW